jgi:pyruvate,water dikinase
MSREYEPWWSESVQRLDGLDQAGALTLFHEAAARFHRAVPLQSTMFIAVVQPLYDAVTRLVEQVGKGDVSKLTAASGNAEMELPIDLWKASRGQLTIAEVIRKHGFHGPAEGELSSRVWREDDTPIRKMVEQYGARDDDQDPARHDAALRQERDEMARELLSALPRSRRAGAAFVLRLARERLPLRGVAKRSFLQAFDVARAAARRVGADLAEVGVLADADDIFYLTAAELRDVVPSDARELVTRRRERRTAYQQLVLPSEWTGMPEATLVSAASDRLPDLTDVITGTGVSVGVIEGVVRVVTSPDFAEVEPDEILVAPTTDPSWSSIMFISAALVVDIGGALSHAAVVARELEIPCVVNTHTGTRQLRTGDRVRVDGTAGTVQVLERAATPGQHCAS